GMIVEHLPIGIVVLRATGAGAPDDADAELVVVDANSNALTLLRCERADVIDRTAASLLGKRIEIESDLWRVLQTGEPLRIDRSAIGQSPDDYVLSWHAFRLASDAVGIIIEDVTDQ